MEERTVYVAFNGATFTDSETCLRYERLAWKWKQVKKSLIDPKQPLPESSFPYEAVVDSFYYTHDSRQKVVSPECFLEGQAFLQELAAFMASED